MANQTFVKDGKRKPRKRDTENPYREAILAVATTQFSKQGYRGTSMRDLGDELGVHPGSLYVHIHNKEEVLFEIVDRISEIHERDMREVTESGLPPSDQLHEIVRRHMKLVAENLEAATVYFHEWKNLSARRRAVIVAKRDSFESALRKIISDGIADGTFRSVDVSLVGFALLGQLNWAYTWYSPSGRLSPGQIANRFADLIIEGLRKR